MTRVACFTLEPTGRSRRWLRRYVSASGCDGSSAYCNAQTLIGEFDALVTEDGFETEPSRDLYAADARWPTACERCGRPFTDDDARQVFTVRIYLVAATMPGALRQVGDMVTLRDDISSIAGAMWDAWWMSCFPPASDGRRLMVMLPNGREWLVDGPASNCTMKDDHAQQRHRCWVRHGEWPAITVDKDGVTCAAGAGSIQAGDYHGFLRGGYLEC